MTSLLSLVSANHGAYLRDVYPTVRLYALLVFIDYYKIGFRHISACFDQKLMFCLHEGLDYDEFIIGLQEGPGSTCTSAHRVPL